MTEHYGVADVTFVVGRQVGSEGATMRAGGVLTVTSGVIAASNDFLVAASSRSGFSGTRSTSRAMRPGWTASGPGNARSWPPTPRPSRSRRAYSII
jgi:hypothetical protein